MSVHEHEGDNGNGRQENIAPTPPANVRVGWVYELSKVELARHLRQFQLDTRGTVDEMRRRFVQFIRRGHETELVDDPLIEDEIDPERQSVSLSDKRTYIESIRKTGLCFDGTSDPISFLEKLDEIQGGYEIPLEQVLLALPIMLKGKALLWFRLCHEEWKSFDEFLADFKLQFVSVDYKFRLQEEIRTRTQGSKEKGKEFILALRTLMRRCGGFWDNDVLDIIYRNLRPDYKVYIRRKDFSTVRDLIRLVDEFEDLQRSSALYKPPPTQVHAYVSDTAYQPAKSSGHVSSKQVAVLGSDTEVQRQRVVGKTSGTKSKLNSRVPDSHARTIVCWKCGRSGHMRRECRMPAKIRCFNCGKEGVLSKDCSCRRPRNVNCCLGAERSVRKPAAKFYKNDDWEKWLKHVRGVMCTPLQKSVSENRMFVNVEIFNNSFQALIDTGACVSYIGNEVAEFLQGKGVRPKKITGRSSAALADGSVVPVKECFEFPFAVQGVDYAGNWCLVPSLTSVMIIGMDMLESMGARIDVVKRRITFGKPEVSVQHAVVAPLHKLEVSHVKGKVNKVSDALSRGPVRSKGDGHGSMMLQKGSVNCRWYNCRGEAVQDDPEKYPDYRSKKDPLYEHVSCISSDISDLQSPTRRTNSLSFESLRLEGKDELPILKPSIWDESSSVPLSRVSREFQMGCPVPRFKKPLQPSVKRKRKPKIFIPLPGGKKLRVTVEQAIHLGMIPEGKSSSWRDDQS